MSTNALVHLARKAAGIGPLTITPKQKYGALAVAGIVDILQATVLVPSTVAGPASPLAGRRGAVSGGVHEAVALRRLAAAAGRGGAAGEAANERAVVRAASSRIQRWPSSLL